WKTQPGYDSPQGAPPLEITPEAEVRGGPLPVPVCLEKDKGPHDDVLAAWRGRGDVRVDAGSMERPARDGAVGHRVIAFEHRDLGRLLLREPVPLVVWTIGEAGGLADAVVVDPVVVDVRLVGEGGPGAEHEGKLLDRLYRLGEVDRHEPARHLRVGFLLGVVLRAPEVAQVLGEQLAAAHAAAVVVQ